MHPEMLLFLSKIRKLSAREDNSDPKSSTVSEISISSERNYQARKNMHAKSYTVHLSAEESGKGEEECGYYMWRQKFQVKPENRVDKRAEIDEWVITLAFTHGHRLSRRKQLSPGVYAFLPTQMVTNFPFIIQADFLLASSREAIPFDSPWNKGILEIFCKPSEVARLKPAFWTILGNAREYGMDLKNRSTHGTYILSSHFDKSTYNSVLEFLGVKSVSTEWYEKCIEGSNLVKEAHEQLYLEIIYFVANNWQNYFSGTYMMSIPLLRYVDRNGVLLLWSISRASQCNDRLCIASDRTYRSRLISWNKEFPSVNRFFLHPSTQIALETFSQKTIMENWLQNHARVEVVSVYSYGLTVVGSLGNDRRPLIAFAHFLYHSLKMKYIESYYLSELCRVMPVIDSYGNVIKKRNSIIVPAKGSKWVGLLGTNPWRNDGYIELSADYKSAGHFAGNYTSEDQLLEFLKKNLHASDVPFINPPNASFPTVSSPHSGQCMLATGMDTEYQIKCCKITRSVPGLCKRRELAKNVSRATILILKCIRYVNRSEDFIRKLKDLKWSKTNMGFHSPNETFCVDPEWECLLKVFDGTPVIDYGFYGSEIKSYKEELKKIGLIMRFEEASKAITQIFKEMVSNSSLTKASVLALLGSYRQLRTHCSLPAELFNCMCSEKWLHTSLGFRSPSEAILFYYTWQTLSPIANLPFIDDADSCHGLGQEIYGYKDELNKLGLTVEAKNGARFVISGLSIPSDPSIMSQATVVSLLACIQRYFECAASPPKGFQKKNSVKWRKTSMGYQCPHECILFDAKQSSLCMEDGPFIDEAFYGSELVSFKDSLARIGVTVNVNFGHDLVARHLRSHKPADTYPRQIWLDTSHCDVEAGILKIPLSKKHILDKYYDKKLLGFFSLAFGVRRGPDPEDYCKLWSTWESSVHELDISDCSAFWTFIATNWSRTTQKLLSGCVKVPVYTGGKITLSNKEDVFIPDDLLVTDLFKKLPEQSLFIWYPPSTIPSMSRARLNSIYDSIGVQRISKSVMKNDSFTLENGCFRTVNSSKVIKVGLLHIILAFLADPALDIPAEGRHRMVSCLLNVFVQENDEPITVGYSVSLSSGEVVNVKASRMLRWERENSKLYMQSSNGESRYKEKIEFATYFAEELSKGLLFEMPDQIPYLAELNKFGSLLDFDDAAVGFLHKSNNLQLFPEDEDFLKSS
ncbi:uncharacterized protein C2845_PM17G09890 [Panicum miliaceum]|uniref:Uncharacterized protein n=1 Tax=Panicum miliaceum TaxID=4540 RepID=A0A3L6Q2Q4_PANMI|nr:uncharacterized protein C2845_PM17G09890 [Panicum miliaceum]